MKTLEATTVDMPAGNCQGQRVTLWDLLFSSNIPEEKRTELLDLYKSGLLSTVQLSSILHTLVAKKEATGRKLNVKVRSPDQREAAAVVVAEHQPPRDSSLDPANWESALRSQLLPAPSADQQSSAWDVLFSERFAEHEREELLSRYRRGSLPLKELTKILSDHLPRTTSSERHLPMDFHTPSSSAEAEEAKEEGEQDAGDLGDKEEALKSRTVEVTAAAFDGRKVSVWDVLHSKYIPEEKRKELLQLYQSGILTIDQMETVVSAIVNKTEEMKSGNQHPSQYDLFQYALELENISDIVCNILDEKTSVWDPFFSRCVSKISEEMSLSESQGATGDLTLDQMLSAVTHIIHPGEGGKERPSRGWSASGSSDSSVAEDSVSQARQLQLKKTLRTTLVPVTVGEYKGQHMCVLDLLFSKYVPQDSRQELLELYRAGTLLIEDMISTITGLLEEAESQQEKRETQKRAAHRKERQDPGGDL
ncbi:hypothetical protein E2320_011838 [Naja naja]|nr:hypothetical protein E2320_011838 [Naja naja]